MTALSPRILAPIAFLVCLVETHIVRGPGPRRGPWGPPRWPYASTLSFYLSGEGELPPLSPLATQISAFSPPLPSRAPVPRRGAWERIPSTPTARVAGNFLVVRPRDGPTVHVAQAPPRARPSPAGFGTVGILYWRLSQATLDNRKESAYWNSNVMGAPGGHH